MIIPELISTVGKALITNDLFQAGKQALTKYAYEAVVQEVANRIGGREYDGYPGRASYRSAQGQVSMWLPGKAMTERPDHVLPLLALVKREILNPGGMAEKQRPTGSPPPPTRHPSAPKATGSRAQWGEPIDDKPKKKEEDDPKQTKMF